MKKQLYVTLVIAFGFPLITTLVAVSQAAQPQNPNDFTPPAVFQAAGITASSIQSTVDAYRAALGNPNNNNNPGPLQSGHREINWDGGNPSVLTTTDPVTPFNGLPKHSRRAVHHTGARSYPSASGRPCSAVQQSNLRHHLQYLQPFTLVRSGGQQRH
jgi:hypothetical protein